MSLFFFKNSNTITIRADKDAKKSARNILIVNNRGKKNISDIKFIIKTGILEKKSKLRSLFEKSDYLITIPFYEDDVRSLLPIINQFIRRNMIQVNKKVNLPF